MHEDILRDYFLGKTDLAALRADMDGAVTQTSRDVFSQYVIKMTADFEVTVAHLVELCDAVLAGQLPPQDLVTIAFCLMTSDKFRWDDTSHEGNLVETTLCDWDSPEINYPLNLQTITKFRHRLLTGNDSFIPEDQSTGFPA